MLALRLDERLGDDALAESVLIKAFSISDCRFAIKDVGDQSPLPLSRSSFQKSCWRVTQMAAESSRNARSAITDIRGHESGGGYKRLCAAFKCIARNSPMIHIRFSRYDSSGCHAATSASTINAK